MKRKLVQQGPSTLMLSLPREFVKRFGLKKGDEVEVMEKVDCLSVIPQGETAIRKAEVHLDEFKLITGRVIGGLYKAGFDEIYIHFKNPNCVQAIQDEVDEMIGFEITQQRPNLIVLKEVSIATKDEFNSMYNRIFFMLETIADDFLEAIKNSNFHLLPDIWQRDRAINKYSNFCRRLLNKRIDQVGAKYYLVEELENIGDQYKEIAKEIYKRKLKPSKEVIEILQGCNTLIKDFFKLQLSFKPADAEVFCGKLIAIEKLINKQLARKPDSSFVLLGYIRSLKQLFFNMLGPLLTEKVA